MYTIVLKSGKEKSVLRKHPWIYSSAVERLSGTPANGETIRIVDNSGLFLAWGAYSQDSQIRVRIWSWDEAEEISPAFFKDRIENALQLRQIWKHHYQADAYRIVHAESDGLPGLVLDRYRNVGVMQVLSSGVEFWRDVIADVIIETTQVEVLYERSDVDVRRLEGLPERTGILRGTLSGPQVKISECSLDFLVDIVGGHKTGFYLDQRINRQIVRELAAGRQTLDCFCYTGGFTVNAVTGGAAKVVSIDSSNQALALAQKNAEANGIDPESIVWLEADVFQALRTLRDRNQKFDLIILDPPKFAPTTAQVERAARGYKDINLLAFKLLHPGGVLVTFSCSSGVNLELFLKIVAGAAIDAGVVGEVMNILHQAPDHPVALNFPEGNYLKGLVIRVK